MAEKTCNTCRCNKICDHNKYGFENCNNYISADVVEVRHGEWKISFDGYYPYCSECGHEPKGRYTTKYCEECGALMLNYDDFKKEE